MQQALAAPACGRLTDIEHVVIFIQENRSFDHYFGAYRGVRGFADPGVSRGNGGLPIFQQPAPFNTFDPPLGRLLPFHLDTTRTNAACTHDISHDWAPQHRSWSHGAMDGFAAAHTAADGWYGALTMGYYTRADLPMCYALADAFTICDYYFCSVLGPTDPNRLYSMSATIDPDGEHGGPLLQTLSGQRLDYFGRFTWTTMPEQLQARGISWKVYAPLDATIGNNVLLYFKQYLDPASPLFQQAFLPSFPNTFLADVKAGRLPQVSWVLAPLIGTEHPPAPSLLGELNLQTLLTAVWSNPALWAKTAIFVTYDENGGFFDHVPPPVAPPGTAGEYITATPLPDPSMLGSPPTYGPIGLGFRVPMLVISPFSRGGFVSSDTFDHTSILRFLEARFGAEVPNLSAWRRQTVGDLTSAFNFAASNYSTPSPPAVQGSLSQVVHECISNLLGFLPYPLPNPQHLPSQERGVPRRPNGRCR